MYRIEDRRAAVSEIQRYLRLSSDRIYSDILPVSIDGIYGSETQSSVSEYQHIAGIPVNGRVDYTTFSKLFDTYREAKFLRRANNFLIKESSFPIKRGDHGNEVILINLMLDQLQKIYKQITKVKINEYYSAATESATKQARQIFIMAPSEGVDKVLFDRMQYELSISAPLN